MSAVGHSAFLQVAFDRFASPELRGFLLRWNIDLAEVESLKPTSAMILAFYDDAEVKQFTNGAVKLWLDHLKQLLYDAEDILDEYATELLLLKLESGYHQTHAQQTHQGIRRYGSEDVTEALKRLRLESEYQAQPHQTEQVRNPVPLTPGETSVSSAVNGINEKFGSKLRDVNERLKAVAQGGMALGLNSSVGSGPSRVFSQKPPTSSLVNRSKVLGREEDMWKIIKWLLSDDKTQNPKAPSPSKNDNNFSVLSIVGMGGAGKTTLAQLVYNHETVKKHFGLKAWVCVAEDFDVVRLTKEILESATGSSPPSNSLDLLQGKLQAVLSEKRFLLVLDDMWSKNREGWESLSTPFTSGRAGSKILVTTRNKGVSSVVSTVRDDHDLKGLSVEACLALVRRQAFMDEDSSDANTKLEVFGQKIVNKCKGSPLAVKTLAGLLRDKTEDSEWKDILENEIWDSREGEILPSLILSYHHLPPILKRCFAYCALFPKDYIFNKIELVLLWMAEGIVQLEGRKRLEDIGAGYFDELYMRSFFELSDCDPSNIESPFSLPSFSNPACLDSLPVKLHIKSFFESSNNTRSGFVMHDLIHDLAEVVSGGICCRREYDKPSQVLATTRHLSYDLKGKWIRLLSIPVGNQFSLSAHLRVALPQSVEGFFFQGKRNDEVMESHDEVMKSLRTLLRLNNASFENKPILPTMQFQFQFLRVLCFKFCCNLELPESIGKLKHLRLLDLSFSNIKSLPNSITSLYNLQTLILNGCFWLAELPKEMGNLVNLRHLFLPPSVFWCFNKMPLGMGNLTCLQTLNIFLVGSKNSSELEDLSQLRGTLKIIDLEKAGNDGTETTVTNLKNKSNLLGLWLRWSAYGRENRFLDSGRDEKVEEDVLDQLQPHTNLEVLWIENYGGMSFPSWMEHPSFSNLETMHLIGCLNCRFLPLLGQLPLLKHLVIKDCSATRMVGSELYRNGFSSANKEFRSLETLHVEWMTEWVEWPEPQVVGKEEALGGGGQFPFLRELIIQQCPKLKMISHRFSNLEKLRIESCHDLRELPQLLPSLQYLYILKCSKLVVLPSLPSIKRLILAECDQMTTLSESYHPSLSPSATTAAPPPVHNLFPFLLELVIERCPNLRELTPNLPSLESLWIENCKEFGFLPMLPSIKELKLQQCKGMAVGMVPHLSSLLSLTIDDVSDLISLPNGFMEHLTALKKLSILNCGELKSLPEGLHKLTNLEILEIQECSFLMKCKFLEPLHTLGLHNLTSLRKLLISGCPALMSIPKGWLPTSLEEFHIRDCPILKSIHDGSDLNSLKQWSVHNCPMLTQWYPKSKQGVILTDILYEPRDIAANTPIPKKKRHWCQHTYPKEKVHCCQH